jgi:hypothetical protein
MRYGEEDLTRSHEATKEENGRIFLAEAQRAQRTGMEASLLT